MKIYAQDSNIIFECEFCSESIAIRGKILNKRQFQTKLNSFYRDHDWRCKHESERRQIIKDAGDMATEIIKKIKSA